MSESSSAEKSIAGLLSNADEQLRRAREYNNRIAQKMYTHTPDTIYTHTVSIPGLVYWGALAVSHSTHSLLDYTIHAVIPVI